MTPFREMDPVADLLGGSRTIAFQSALAHSTGSALAGLLLSQLWYWSRTDSARERDGWFYKTQDEIFDETGMTRREQETARKKLVELGILEEKFQGVPRKLFYRLDREKLYAHLADYAQQLPQQEQERMERRRQVRRYHRQWRDLRRSHDEDVDVEVFEEEAPPSDQPLHNVQNRHYVMAENAIMQCTKPPLNNGGKRHATTKSTTKKTSSEDSSRAGSLPVPVAQLQEAATSAAVSDRPDSDAQTEASIADTERLVADLVAAGLNRRDAQRLAITYGEEAQLQLQYLPYKTDVENPGAYLRTAIEGQYSPPAAYIHAKGREASERNRRERAQRKQTQEALLEAQRQAEDARIDSSIKEMENEAPEAFLSFQAFVQERRRADEAKFQQVAPSARARMLNRLHSTENLRTLYTEWVMHARLELSPAGESSRT